VAWVIGVDTGGTFTDAFAADESGRVISAKTPSTPPNFADGFLTAISDLADELGGTVEHLLVDTSYIVHGTTSTLNSLVTGDVAKVGFLTTRGHGDSISIMNLEGRYAGLGPDQIQHMARTNKPPALVPRSLLREVDERIDYKGSVVVPLDEDGARTAVSELVALGIEAIAVSLLWSFANPEHERRLREIVEEVAPGMFVALSSEVSPRIREYARSATTIMNTQVGPRLKQYLEPLEWQLRDQGFAGALLVMQGSGGSVTAADAPAHAITTIGSVLTGGIIGCTRLATALNHRDVISTDIGGTTFLVGLVRDGEPVTTTGTVLNQYSINTPMVDVHTIGAGGGAIAWVDAGGNLHVGPRSAGARPGPACYGEGGTEPTVTDADLLLGIINPDNFLSGRKKLDVDLAAAAVRRVVADPLGLSVDDAAAAIYAIQNAQTADLVRKVVVNTGQDPRDFVVYAYGGAGPMHCVSYSADLGIREVVVPLGSTAAVFSAYGLASSDVVLTAELSAPTNLPAPAGEASRIFADLEEDLKTRLERQGLDFARIDFGREMDIRYTMQLAEVATPVPGGVLSDEDLRLVQKTFEERYEDLYGKGSGFPDAGMQAITFRVRATGSLPVRPQLPNHPETASGEPPASSTRDVLLDIRLGREKTAIYDYRQLAAGHEFAGPAVVEAPTTTVAIPRGTNARVDHLGNLTLTLQAMGVH
jgi:N-methylhydantoinase A